MRQVLLLSLAALTALNGCANPAFHKPALQSNQSTSEPHAEVAPTISVVHDSGTYALKNLGDDDAAPLATVHLHRGDRIGFRRGCDHSLVAVAGQEIFPVPDGTFGWIMVESSQANSRHQANEQTTEVLDQTKRIIWITCGIIGVCGIIVLGFLCLDHSG